MASQDATARRLFFVLLGAYLLLCAAAAVFSYRKRPAGLISSDGKGYYAWLRSVALDRDIDFANDYRLLYPPEPLPPQAAMRTPRGVVPDKYPIGVAIVEAPGFVVGHLAAVATGADRNGASAPYQFAVTLWLQLFCVLGVLALWLTLLRLGVSAAVATLVVASAMGATNLVHYVASPTMSHGPGLAVLCFALYVIVAARGAANGAWRMALAGALLGLAAIIRPSNAALAPFFVVCLFAPLRGSASRCAAFVAGALVPLILQVAVTSAEWGRVTLSGYAGEGFTSGLPGVAKTLFSNRHGLFAYHPWYFAMLLLCVLALRRRESRAAAIGALLSFALLAVVNGLWSTWWFGDSFGNRAFIEIIPAFVVAAAQWLNSLVEARRQVVLAFAATALVASAANALLWGGFILHRYPASGEHTIAQAYLWPLHN